MIFSEGEGNLDQGIGWFVSLFVLLFVFNKFFRLVRIVPSGEILPHFYVRPASIQRLSEIMAFLRLLVLRSENTIGVQICGNISIKGRNF